MATITKLALTQINSRLASENEDLRKQVADLQLNLEMVVEAHANAEVDLARAQRAVPGPAPRPSYVMPAWQAERAASMAAAREMAMRTRMAVKV